MIKLVAIEIEAANQRADRTVTRVKRDKRTFYFGRLSDLPALCALDQAHNCARA